MARWHDSMTRLDEGESALVSVPSSAPLPIHYRDETPLGTACSCPGSPCVVSAKDRGSTALRKQLLQTRFSYENSLPAAPQPRANLELSGAFCANFILDFPTDFFSRPPCVHRCRRPAWVWRRTRPKQRIAPHVPRHPPRRQLVQQPP